jgi:hypothetical protein
MTLAEWAQTLSIATSIVALVVSLYGFARFVRRWWVTRRAKVGNDRSNPAAIEPKREH